MRVHRVSLSFTFLAAGILFAGSAHAHELNVFATVESGVIHARVTYRDGTPAKNAQVSIHGPQNENLASLSADADGRVEYQTVEHVRHVVIAETEDGHRAQFDISADQLGSESSPHGVHIEPHDLDARIAGAVAKEIRPLREQLDQYEQSTRFRDILGGIGFIVGLAGVVALVKANKKAKP